MMSVHNSHITGKPQPRTHHIRLPPLQGVQVEDPQLIEVPPTPTTRIPPKHQQRAAGLVIGGRVVRTAGGGGAAGGLHQGHGGCQAGGGF